MANLLDPLLPIRVTINNVDVTAFYRSRSLQISLTLGADADTCRVALEDYNGTLGAVAGWDELRVTEQGYGTTLFAGFVVAAQQKPLAGGGVLWSLTATDKGALLQKVTVTANYTAKFGGAIVRSLAATYAPWLDLTHVAAGVKARDLRFDRVALSDAFKKLAELDGYDWWVDDTALWYIPQAQALAAPFALADGLNCQPVNGAYTTRYPYLKDSLEVSRDYVDIRNRVIVHGGTRASPPQTELFTADGVKQEFPVVHAPVNVYIAIYIDGFPQRFGREYIDDPTQYDILTNWQHGVVKFASAPAAGKVIQVIYTYDDPLRVTVTDATSAALYCPPELAYFDYMHVDGALASETACEAAALEILAKYAYEQVYGGIGAPKLGLKPGQMLKITDGALAWVDAEYLIRSATIREVANKVFATDVRFGNRQPSLLDAMLGLAGASGGVAAGASGGQGDILQAPKDLRQPTGYQYIQTAGGEWVLVPVYHQLVGTGMLDYSDANNSQYVGLAL